MSNQLCALFLTLSLNGQPSDHWRVSDVVVDSRCPSAARCVQAGELIVEVIDTRVNMAPIRIRVDDTLAPGPWSAKSVDRNTIQVCKAKPAKPMPVKRPSEKS